jgi:glycosyltransferase involved in cell wall biosynthesis
MCYYLANAGAKVHLHICTQFFSTKEELLRFFGLADLTDLHTYFYFSPFARRVDLPLFSNPDGTRLRRFLKYSWGALFHLRRIVSLAFRRQRASAEILFLRGHRFPTLYILLKRLLSLTAVYEIHEISYLNNVREPDLLSKKVMLDFERLSYRGADGIVFISQTLKDIVEKKWGTVKKAIVLPSGARVVNVAPLPADAELTKLFFVGNYYYFSGLDYLIEALALLGSEVTLTIVGGGGSGDRDRDRLRTLARSLDLEDRVEFRGFLEPRDLMSAFAESEVLVMPHTGHIRSKYFVSPVKLFEYLGARRPIVASDLPTIREILEDGRNAVLVESENAEALANGIRRVIGDGAFARRIAENAFRTAASYSADERGERLKCFFIELSAKDGSGPGGIRATADW